MPMIRIMPILGLIILASCVGGPPQDPGLNGPTGRVSDGKNVEPIAVRNVWKMDLQPRTLKLVTAQLPFGKTARYDEVHFDGYFNSAENLTTVGVYGNVTTSTDYGTVNKNGYYATWEQTGRVTTDFPVAAWRPVDVEVMDQQY
jgi:hypothetical protein